MTILKKGYLYKLPRSGMLKHWNKRWVVLHSSSREGNLRMEYYDTEGHETREIQKRIIPLDGCHAISQIDPVKSKKHVFDFTTKLGRVVFATDSQEDLDDWIKSIKTAVQFDLELKKQKKLGISLKDQLSLTNSVQVDNSIYERSQTGKYEVLIEPNEDSNRLDLEGRYLLVISMDGVQLVKPENGQVFVHWDYKHLKKYGKSTGKFNLESGRASRTGPGKFVFVTEEGHNIFTQIHGNIQSLGSKKEGTVETAPTQAQSLPRPSPQSRNLPRKSHEAPAAVGTNLIPEYAVVDKSKKKKKRSSMMSHTYHDSDIPTSTGAKAGVFRKLDENVYDTPILDSIKPKGQTSNKLPAGNVSFDDDRYSTPSFFDSAPTKTVTKANTTSQQPQEEIESPFGDEDPFAGYASPSFDSAPSVQEPGKVKSSGKNPFFTDDHFIDNPGYEVPMLPEQGMKWQENKLVQSVEKSETKMAVTGDYDVPPELDELAAFSTNPFSNSSNTYTSPFTTNHDYTNVTHKASSNEGTTTTTALRFESDDEDEDGAVINPLLDVDDFAKYLNVDGDDDMWADLVQPKFN